MFPPPLGLRLLWTVFPRLDPATRLRRYRYFILMSTFLAYLCYHMTRRPIAVVKAVLNHDGNCSTARPQINRTVPANESGTWCDWEPFSGDSPYFGYLDSAYLFSYAICMFGSGFVAERMHLRYFLSLGLMLSGLMTYAFGIGYTLNLHSFWFYLIVQIISGGVQSSGWPAVVTLMSNWYGKTKKGLIFGIWNAHTSVGNIVGALIAGSFVDYNWGMSFFVPGLICCAVGLFVLLFVPPVPEEVGIDSEAPAGADATDDESLVTVAGASMSRGREIGPDERTALLETSGEHKQAISFFRALAIPGVIEFSLALFFAKLVAYTFLFWLPLYLESSTGYDAQTAAKLSTAFDIGGIFGGILAGYLSDRTGASATTSVVFLFLAIPMLFVYKMFGTVNVVLNVLLLLCTGFLVNGPYALITTAVSAELGCHPSINKKSNALATVTAIIDGTGSVGAALGPLFAAVLKNALPRWLAVFLMVMISNLLALICLLRISIKEIARMRRREDSSHVE
ncbi:glucose-6-phosphate exchanger SLC37A2 [Galendromus occidentalis]|uniref:Sugar phosphate exchanger 3 n=1 Tax=Galendromus occidentalis TaxID=34638 RepID=A0AAJ6W0G8_9ACAR|nr:glucose-6-phosphate exchanger SLC37A2 [Galendromus occidentalis]